MFYIYAYHIIIECTGSKGGIMIIEKIKESIKIGDLKYRIINYFWVRNPIRYVPYRELRLSLWEAKCYKKLKNKYLYVFKQIDSKVHELNPQYSNRVWTCWFQGYDEAPELSKVCISRIIDIFGKDRVTVITEDNVNNYIEIPEHIMQKFQEGKVSYAHLSDYIRVSLLEKWGGCWLDATVYIMDNQIPTYFVESPFFAFSNEHRKSVISISNWFMSSYKENKVVLAVRTLLEEYWKKENGIINYYMMHLFVRIAFDYYSDDWKKMPKFSNINSHMLTYEIFDKYDEKRLEQIKALSPVQKLSNKFEFTENIENTFYDVLIKKAVQKI